MINYMSQFPLEMQIAAQLSFLPVSKVVSIRTFNIMFCCLLLKDFLYKIECIIAVHHMIGIFGCIGYSRTPDDVRGLAIAEFGSAMYNIYTLAKQRNVGVELVYALYAITMSLSNIRLLIYLINHREKRLYITAPFYALILTRQYYIYIV
jgi:hypothetical protein